MNTSNRKTLQKSLERHTDAISRGTLEFDTRGSKVSVRYKDLRGYVVRNKFPQNPVGRCLALEIFWKYFDKLKREVQTNEHRSNCAENMG